MQGVGLWYLGVSMGQGGQVADRAWAGAWWESVPSSPASVAGAEESEGVSGLTW